MTENPQAPAADESAGQSPSTTGKSRPSRRLALKVGCAGLILIVVGLLLVPFLIPTEYIRTAVLDMAEDATGRSCELEEIEIGWFSGLTLVNFRVAGGTAQKEPLLAVGRVRVDANLVQVLTGELTVRQIVISDANLNIVRAADGTFNFDDILAGKTAQVSQVEKEADLLLSGAVEGESTGGSDFALAVEEAQIKGMTIHYQDLGQGMDAVWQVKDLMLKGSDLNEPMAVDGVIAPAESEGDIRVAGSVDLLEELAYDPVGSVELKAELKEIEIAPLLASLNALQPSAGAAPNASSVMVKQGKVSGPLGIVLAGPALKLTPQKIVASGIVVAVPEYTPHPLSLPVLTLGGEMQYRTDTSSLGLQAVELSSPLQTATVKGELDLSKDARGVLTLDAAVRVQALATFLHQHQMGGALPKGLAGDVPLLAKVTFSGKEIRPALSLKGGEIRIPVARAEAPLKIVLDGAVDARMSEHDLVFDIGLDKGVFEVPATPWAKALRASAQGRVQFDWRLDQLVVTSLKLTARGAEAENDWLVINARGDVKKVTGGAPVAELKVAAGVGLRGASSTIATEPFASGAYLEGGVQAIVKVIFDEKGCRLAPTRPGAPLLWSTADVTLHNLEKDFQRLPLGKVQVQTPEVQYDLAGDIATSDRIVLTTKPAQLVLSKIEYARGQGEGGAKPWQARFGYLLQATRKGAEELLENLGILSSPVTRLDIRGELRAKETASAPGLTAILSNTYAQAGLALKGRAYRCTFDHNLRFAVSQKMLPAAGARGERTADWRLEQIVPDAVRVKVLPANAQGAPIVDLSVVEDSLIRGPLRDPAAITINASLQARLQQVEQLLQSLEIADRDLASYLDKAAAYRFAGGVSAAAQLVRERGGWQASKGRLIWQGVSFTDKAAGLKIGAKKGDIQLRVAPGAKEAEAHLVCRLFDPEVSDLKTEEVLFKDTQLDLDLRTLADEPLTSVKVKSVRLAGESVDATLRGAGEAKATPSPTGGDPVWSLADGTSLELAIDAEKLARAAPALMPEGYAYRGKIKTLIHLDGPMKSTRIQGTSDFDKFIMVDSAGEEDPIILHQAKGRFGGVLDADLLLAGVPKDPKNFYAFMKSVSLHKGVLALDPIIHGRRPIREMQLAFSAERGTVHLHQGTFRSGGNAEVKGKIDFSRHPAPCDMTVQLVGVDLRQAVGNIKGCAEFKKGTLHLPAPDADNPLRLRWRGLTVAQAWPTLQLDKGTIRADDIHYQAKVGRDILYLGPQLLSAVKAGRILGGKLDSKGEVEKTESLKRISGRYSVKNGHVAIPEMHVLGESTADFFIKGEITPTGKIDFKLYPVRRVRKFIPVDKYLKWLTEKLPHLTDKELAEIKKEFPARIDAAGKERKIFLRIQGQYNSPKPTNIPQMFGQVTKIVAPELTKSALRAINRFLGGSDDALGPDADAPDSTKNLEEAIKDKAKDKVKDLLKDFF